MLHLSFPLSDHAQPFLLISNIQSCSTILVQQPIIAHPSYPLSNDAPLFLSNTQSCPTLPITQSCSTVPIQYPIILHLFLSSVRSCSTVPIQSYPVMIRASYRTSNHATPFLSSTQSCPTLQIHDPIILHPFYPLSNQLSHCSIQYPIMLHQPFLSNIQSCSTVLFRYRIRCRQAL